LKNVKLQFVKLPNAKFYKNHKYMMKAVLKKWSMIIDILEQGKIPTNVHDKSCAFCVYFSLCSQCYIFKYTGEPKCLATPWVDFIEYLYGLNLEMALKSAKRMYKLLEEIAKHYGWL